MTFQPELLDELLQGYENPEDLLGNEGIPQSLRNTYPQIPWKSIAGMHDKVIHQYFGVNLQVLWDTVQQDLPALQPVIAQMLNDLSNP